MTRVRTVAVSLSTLRHEAVHDRSFRNFANNNHYCPVSHLPQQHVSASVQALGFRDQ